MGSKLVIGPINKGLRNDRTAFNIDNDSFPTLINAYQWRGRVKRKRGTSILGRLTRNESSQTLGVIASESFTGNIFSIFGLETNSSIVPGSVVISTFGGTYTFQDINLDSKVISTAGLGWFQPITNITKATNAVVTVANSAFSSLFQVYISNVVGMTEINNTYQSVVSSTFTLVTLALNTLGFTPYSSGGLIQNVNGTVNYANGDLNLLFNAAFNGQTLLISFNYYPGLPVMGLEDLNLHASQFPGTLAFDTKYSYNILQSSPYNIYDVSFYKDPPVDGVNLPGYVPKIPTNFITPTSWNGQDYQQFWSVNYQGAFWVTNGINIPFSAANVGMQYALPADITYVGNTPTTLTVTINNCPLIIGDFVFVNEWIGANFGLNFQSGYVTAAAPNTPALALKTITITFPFAVIGAGPFTPGIIQYLTNRSDTTKDCIRWYDGDPTDGNPTNPTLTGNNGWVNFCPPLSQSNFSIADLPAKQYYLVGARMIVPFKDRLLFLGPVVQTSAAGSQVYLQDTIVYSQNGTPYYTSSFTYAASAPADATQANIVFHPILVPDNQTATAPAYFEDQTGFGGWISAGLDQPMITSSSNEDVIIIGFTNIQTRLIYSGNDVLPFNFYLINSELGSGSTFSAVNMDSGVITRGQRGYILTGQTQCARIDLDIPDQVFEIRLLENGNERVCSQRDFINEWIYFTYPSDQSNYEFPTDYKFPNQTLQYNYRDNTWAIFNESYTTYGSFTEKTGFTWATVGATFTSWSKWNESWDSGSSNLLQPKVIAGNQQGFIVFRDDGTNESNSLTIQSFSSSLVTSPDHNLTQGDYITISGVLGTIGTQVNGKIFSVANPTSNNFILNPAISTGTYVGGGLIQKMYVPYIQTRQFPTAWEMARKTRIGVQQYLLSKTSNAQIQLLIFLSQDDSNPYNDGPIIPDLNSVNDSLIYSTVLYTCPESTNLGLTPANTNLQMPTASNQQQIWHRINTSLLGDTIQLGFTLSDEQMRHVDDEGNPISQFAEIELHSIILDCSPSSLLA